MSMRKITREVPPSWSPPATGASLELKLKVVTPMFGGGFEARTVDGIIPIRAAAIRGNLRYWWRATAGARYATAQELYAAEAALWGGASQEGKPGGPGRVALTVRVSNGGRATSASDLIPRATPQTGPQEGVFLFPFDQQGGAQYAMGQEGIEFDLMSSCADEAKLQEVRIAVAAWVLFGGVGARTRRGCGALATVDPPDWVPRSPDALEGWLKSVPSAAHRLWPMLGGGYAVLGEQSQSAQTAWRTLGKFWSAFRKGHVGIIEYSPMSGGKWADARKLRDLQPGQNSISLVKPFLGLPIIYQDFPRSPRPFAGEVKPGESSRLGSPVVLKPISLGSAIYPLVLTLRGPAPKSIRVRDLTLALSVPNDDDVLKAYKHPLVAVIQEAQRLPHAKVLKIGGEG